MLSRSAKQECKVLQMSLMMQSLHTCVASVQISLRPLEYVMKEARPKAWHLKCLPVHAMVLALQMVHRSLHDIRHRSAVQRAS